MPRSALANAYMMKAQFDCEHERSVDVDSWYNLQNPHALPKHLEATFENLRFDQDTQQFLDNSRAISDSVCLQIYYAFMSWILSWFMSKTSINGLLNRGSMFLFSSSQFSQFLDISPDWINSDKSVLDLGAGDGCVTQVMSRFYRNVYATEASAPMIWRLEEKKFKVIDLDTWAESRGPYNLISALNLLDRHPKPFKLLRQLRELSERNENAPILLGCVFPWYQYSEFTPDHSPEDDIRLSPGSSWEQQVGEFTSKVLIPSGFRIVKWTKLPYLCEGDPYQSYYILYDALFWLVPA